MKRTSKLWLAVFLAAVGFTSCSQDERQDPTLSSGQSGTVSLNLEARVENDALRGVDFEIGLNTLNQLVPTPKFTEGQLVPVHTIIKGNNGAFGVKTINWKYNATRGRLVLETRDAGNEISIANFNNDTDWYVSGVIGGTLDGTKVKIDHPTRVLKGVTVANGSDLGNIEVPYAFGWTKLKLHTLEGSSFKVGDATPVVFKPRGAFIGYKLGNKQAKGYTFTPTGFTVYSDAFSDKGLFELNTAPVAGSLPSWTEASPEGAMNYSFEAPVSSPYVSDDNAVSEQTYYAWVMPTSAAESGTVATAQNRILLKGTSSNPDTDYTKIYLTDYAVGAATGGKVIHGRVHRMTARATQRLGLPIEYVVDRNLDKDGTGFVGDDLVHDNTVMGYFTYADAVARFSNIQIGGVDYFLPSALEQATALGAQNNLSIPFHSGPNDYDRNKERARFYNTDVVTRATYRVVDEKTAYAIRHTWGTNEFRSAYRYRYVLNNSDRKTNHLEISVLYLGPDFTGSIDDIVAREESDWSDKGITKKFPLTGYYGGPTYTDVYIRALLWSSTSLSVDSLNAAFFEAIWKDTFKKIQPHHSSVAANKMTVRLFKKNL